MACDLLTSAAAFPVQTILCALCVSSSVICPSVCLVAEASVRAQVLWALLNHLIDRYRSSPSLGESPIVWLACLPSLTFPPPLDQVVFLSNAFRLCLSYSIAVMYCNLQFCKCFFSINLFIKTLIIVLLICLNLSAITSLCLHLECPVCCLTSKTHNCPKQLAVRYNDLWYLKFFVIWKWKKLSFHL